MPRSDRGVRPDRRRCVRAGDTFGFGAKTLFGGGRSDSTETVQVLDRGKLASQSVRVRQDFLVAEAEIDAILHFTRHVRLTLGAGYRFTGRGRDQFSDGLRQNLNGAVGSIGLQIGGGS